jgi:hypothetical protein
VSNTEESSVLADLVTSCVHAVLAGQPTVTISANGKRPPGFPRGELLSVGANGMRNYAVHPVKVLTWMHDRAAKKSRASAAESEKD